MEQMQNEWNLLVDNREKNAHLICQSLQEHGVKASRTNLAVGDYAWVFEEKVWIILERKSQPDFANSIKDGRYRDQIARIGASEVPYKFLLVVGDLPNPLQGDGKTVDSAVLHINMATDIKICYVISDGHVIPFLVKMYRYLHKNPGAQMQRIAAPFLETLQRTSHKRKLCTQKEVFISQLCCIDGVSEKKAKCIATNYTSMKKLLKAYDNERDTKSKKMLLASIKVGSRNLGPKVSARIYEAINPQE